MPGRLPVLPPLPSDHEFAVEVPGGPSGGARCATCMYYAPAGGQHGTCRNPYYQAVMGTGQIPRPPERWCCDVWED